ncbi:hypothetical protein GQ457_15G013980 [Hibiscus cannabinus]
MQSNDFLTDLPKLNISDDKCDSCQLGKSHRLSFSLDGVKRANMKLELVHSDLCGPMKISSMNDIKYFVLFIDDLTMMCWVYFLKSKLNMLSTFKEFKIFVENQSACKLKVLRTNKGREYVSNEFNDLCRYSRILHQLTIPQTSEQNGVCERRNRIVLEMKHDLRSISELLVIIKDVENKETSDWFVVADTTDVDEVIKIKSLASVYEGCNLVFVEPTSFGDATKVPEWIDAMKLEISAIEKNVRLVVKGYAQICGVDYDDTFSPVARLDTIRLLIAIAGQLGWNVFHLDVKSAFLKGELEEDINKLGFQKSINEDTLYLKKDKNACLLVISLYVDDLLVMGSNGKVVSEFKLCMQKEFEMSDLGLMSYFLRMKINQSKAGIFISQNKYALDV